MASRHMLPPCCSSELSGSKLLSVLQSELSPLLSPLSRTTSQRLLDASLLSADSVVSPGAKGVAPSASASACGSASGFAAPSRFSLLLESQCLPLSLARRKRAALRPPLLLFGLLDGLLVRLSEGADFLVKAGEAVGETTKFSTLPLQLLHTDNGKNRSLVPAGSTFRQVVEASRG